MLSATIESLPVVVLYPHGRCNCRCVMCDIWKDSSRAEISAQELQRHLQDFEALSVRWVVLSGGEPLMHSDLFRLCALLRERHIRVTLLSTGLLLERNAEAIIESIDDIIVSLDGPPAVHDRIRRVSGAFALLQRGVQAIHNLQPAFAISGRSTVQRQNYFCLHETAVTARQLGLQSISFLAADVTSTAFNRPESWTAARQSQVALAEDEIAVLESEIGELVTEFGDSGFVRESPEKLARIVSHYRAHLSLCEPVSPRCNAPWVSAVIESDGAVRPCFFHKVIGNVKQRSFLEVLNSPEAKAFRRSLDIASDPICRRCVCSLNLASPRMAQFC